MIYLDNAATTLIKPPEVQKAVLKAMQSMASPGRGTHRPAMLAAEELYECRECAASFFNAASPENVVFTMNATHALNIAIKSLVRQGSRVLISGFEHNSVLRPLIDAGADIKICGRKLFDEKDILREFRENIAAADAAVCTHISNAFGFILPIYEIAQLCRENSVPLIVDASQSAGILDVDMEKLGAEFIAMPGHKGLFGPQGTGILLCRETGRPLMQGGSGSDSASPLMPQYLPDRLEAGTHNVCGIAGLHAGLKYILKHGRESIFNHEKRLLKHFINRLRGSRYELFTGGGRGQCGLISLRHPGLDPDSFSSLLSEKGIAIRSGLHCAPLAHESAGTFKTGTARFSFSPFVSLNEAETVCRMLLEIL